MFSAMLFAIATVALVQFGLYYWRAMLVGVASQAISGRVLEAAHLAEPELSGADFRKLASLHELTPELKTGGTGLGFVSPYFELLQNVEAFFGSISPALLRWSERESILCARYAAVKIDRRLQANLAQAASIRSC